MEGMTRQIIDSSALPKYFPTHMHEPVFWESLGRAVGTFGFLEETLGKAIFSFTATKPYNETEIKAAYEAWLPKLENSLKDTLWNLIESYGKAVREHPDVNIENFNFLLSDLKEASIIRNVICHGSWRAPNSEGESVPLFVNKNMKHFITPINVAFLNQVQSHTTELICSVINTVTHMGWQFPGSNSAGKVIW